MRSTRTSWIFGMVTWLALGACRGPGDDAPREVPEKVRAAVDEALVAALDGQTAPGLTLTLTTPEWGAYTTVVGVADADTGEPMTVEHVAPVGSVTKTFTGAVVHQLIAEGRFTEETPVDERLPELGVDPRIRVRDLLGHTSGIPNYTALSDFPDAGTAPITPAALYDYAVQGGLDFDPGTDAAYSNTGYILLGMIVEAELGAAWLDIVHERLLDPYDLDAIALIGAEQMPGPLVAPHRLGQVAENPDPSWMWAAFGLAGHGEALCSWMTRVVEPGEVLDAASLEAMARPAIDADGVPTETGHGLMTVDHDGVALRGYVGSTLASRGEVFVALEAGTCVSFYANDLFLDRDRVRDAVWDALRETGAL